MASHSVTVWDDEAQMINRSETNAWGDVLKQIAVRKAGKAWPEKGEVYSRRNDVGNGVVFEWD